jgi:hypothetical protein
MEISKKIKAMEIYGYNIQRVEIELDGKKKNSFQNLNNWGILSPLTIRI